MVVVILGAYYFVFAAAVVAILHFATTPFFGIGSKTNAMILTPAIMKRKRKPYGCCHISKE